MKGGRFRTFCAFVDDARCCGFVFSCSGASLVLIIPGHPPLPPSSLLTGNLELGPGTDVDVKDFQNNWLPGKINALQGSTVSERVVSVVWLTGSCPLYS